MLVRGAGVRANIFRAPVETNVVDVLVAEGYDGWLENWRASIDVAPNRWTLDQAAAYDHPAAVEKVLAETGAETMQAIIHCQGSTSFAMSAVAGLVPLPALPHPRVHRQAIADGRVYYPSASLSWLREHRPDANVFAQYEWGGYFIDGLYPEGHVYIDGRADMYGALILGDYFDIMAAQDGWEGLLEESGADAVVVVRSPRRAPALPASAKT